MRPHLVATLLVTLLVMPLFGHGASSFTSKGPTSPQEAEILWRSAREDFDKGADRDAIYALQRIVDRYPGHAGYVESHRMLGHALLRMGRPSKAIPPLRQYIGLKGGGPEALRARLLLVRAHLKAGNRHEALLASMEILNSTSQLEITGENRLIHLEGILVKGWSLVALGKDDQAAREVVTFERHGPTEPALRQELGRLNLELKVRECGRLPGSGRHTEEETRSSLRQRGTCLLEAMVLFFQTLKEGESQWLKESQERLATAFEDYARVAETPPLPPTKKLNRVQERRYREELSATLRADYRETRDKARELLESWRNKLPQTVTLYVKDLSLRLN